MASASAERDRAPSQREVPEHSLHEHESKRIHILGLGSIGKFFAHAIRSASHTLPISLMFHRPSYISGLKRSQCDLTVTSNDTETTCGPFDVELALPILSRPTDAEQEEDHAHRVQVEAKYGHLICNEPIRHLIVTVKAQQTVSALLPLKHRLGPESTILFCQNGMGSLEEVFEHVWPDSEKHERPSIMQSINSHGVHATGVFSAIHAGHGIVYVSIIPPSQSPTGPEHFDHSSTVPPTSMHLLRTLTGVPLLAAIPVPAPTLHKRALEKLAVNCVINPLSVLLDAQNESVLNNFSLTRVYRLLLAEISLVIRNLPEMKGVPNIDVTFSPERLEAAVVSVAQRTAKNISSMLQDVRRGNATEIDYMNGYIVKRGEEVGIKPTMNYMITHLVIGKQQMVSREIDNYVPSADGGNSGGRVDSVASRLLKTR